MKRFHTLAMSCLLTLCLLFTSMPVSAAPASASRSASAQAAAEAAMEYGGATSVQYALWQDGEITLSGSAGVYSKRKTGCSQRNSVWMAPSARPLPPQP